MQAFQEMGLAPTIDFSHIGAVSISVSLLLHLGLHLGNHLLHSSQLCDSTSTCMSTTGPAMNPTVKPDLIRLIVGITILLKH